MNVRVKLLAVLLVAVTTIGCLKLNVDTNARNATAPTSWTDAREWNTHLSALEYEQIARRRLRAAREAPSQELLDAYDKYYTNYEQLHRQVNLTELSRIVAMMKSATFAYSDIYIHRYDDLSDLLESGGADANQELCLAHLTELVGRAEQLELDGYNSSDINLIQLLDTFGQPTAGALSGGDFYWPGMYSQCLKFNIQLERWARKPDDLQALPGERTYQEVKVTQTRYCLASLRHPNWPNDDVHETHGMIKRAVCLPKACDSLKYRNKFELIRRLLETQARPMDRGSLHLSDLYCLPDEQSSLRQFWRSPASLVTFVLLASWIGLQLFVTFWLKKGRSARPTGTPDGATKLHVFRYLSISDNMAELFDTSKTPAPAREADQSSPASGEVQQGQAGGQASTVAARSRIVDLSSLDALKVIAMSHVIIGHVLLALAMNMNNVREQADRQSLPTYLANLLPAFAVNTFFTITGILTAYLLFKRNQSADFMSSPRNWLVFIVYRYLRIMPMYALAVVYLKTLAKYTSSGPLWDYGTSAMGHRRNCELESPWWTLLFGANFKHPIQHCIPAAWYLANDFQFFLVTPILLTILHRSARVGKRVLILGMLAGYLAGFWSILTVQADITPAANYMPHGFKTYLAHLSHSYTRPQYRIPAYLFGLLIGFILFEFEQQQLKYLRSKTEQELRKDSNNNTPMDTTRLLAELQPPRPPAVWVASMKNYGFVVCVVCLLFCFLSPAIGTNLNAGKPMIKFLMSIIMPAIHLAVSIAVGTHIFLAATGFGSPLVDRILAHPLWKPLAKLGLSALVCNIEVCAYIVHSSTRSFYVDYANHFGLDLLCIVTVYVVSGFIYILFEAPMRGALNHLVALLTSKVARRRKVE